jgi:hypothetical protein
MVIETRIKQIFKTKAAFCEAQNLSYKDFASKVRTFKTKLAWLNAFLKPLNLKVEIVNDDGSDLNNP